jgi:hypothetical protein
MRPDICLAIETAFRGDWLGQNENENAENIKNLSQQPLVNRPAG